MNVLIKADEIRYYLEDSAAKALFCFAGTAELDLGAQAQAAFDMVESCEHFILIGTADGIRGDSFEEVLATADDTRASAACSASDTAVIPYRSGTTGRLEGAELTHVYLVPNALGRDGCFIMPRTAPTRGSSASRCSTRSAWPPS